jgi:uncharacterized protein YjbI with pentapeptide repeats
MLCRRTMLKAAATATITTVCIAPYSKTYSNQRRVSQSELSDAIEHHTYWLEGRPGGKRAVFSNCDLSNLDFHSSQTESVNLSGSDFTEANLIGIVGTEVNFSRASLQQCNMSRSELHSPVFSGATLRRAICADVEWGWPSRACTAPYDAGVQNMASFMNTDLSYVTLTDSRIRGYFWGSTFHDSTLEGTDFSWSYFSGKRDLVETSFSGANLKRTMFRNVRIEAARFKRARFEGTDFSYAEIDPTVDLLTLEDRPIILTDRPLLAQS